jgi:hypothetical protein
LALTPPPDSVDPVSWGSGLGVDVEEGEENLSLRDEIARLTRLLNER